MQFRGKVDWWIGAAIVAGMLMPLFAGHWPWNILIAVPIWVLVFGFCYPQTYKTADDALIIRAGFTTRRILYASISAVRLSSDTRSALAMSLDRVQVVWGSSSEVLIAPDNQELFFAEMARHAPQLQKRGQDLVISFNSI